MSSGTAKPRKTVSRRSSLGKVQVIAFAATANPARAEAFYRDTRSACASSKRSFPMP